MRVHQKPRFKFKFDVAEEKKALRAHLKRDDRKIPKRSADNVLIATWNLTNFGAQERTAEHIELMAEVIKPFDVVAIQELADNLSDFELLLDKLGSGWSALYSDIAGNQERLGYLYRKSRVKPTGLAAELAMLGYERRRIRIAGVTLEDKGDFPGFNRNPYIVTFRAGSFEFSLVNVHLYWSNFGLRRLETLALAKWAKGRSKKQWPPGNDIILIGDFNMPHARRGDKIYDGLKKFGLAIPKHETNLIGTNLAGDADYDELAFFPSRTQEDFSDRMGVLDFDNAFFANYWDPNDKNKQRRFFQYMRYYIADHRPLWAEFLRAGGA